MSNFSYADDMAVVCSSAFALNEMLKLCEGLAARHYVEYSTSKSECMTITPQHCRPTCPPAIYLNGEKLKYVNKFTYLGHIITSDFYDEDDIKKETRNLCARGNAIIRQFSFCNMDVKCNLFRSYCYSFYCGSLWTNFRMATFNRLKVCFNMIMRRLAGVAPWQSAREMFANLGLQSFAERHASVCEGVRARARASENTLIHNLVDSDAAVWSALWQRWTLLLDGPPPL